MRAPRHVACCDRSQSSAAGNHAPRRSHAWLASARQLGVPAQTRIRYRTLPNCGSRLKIIAAIEDPHLIVKILTHLGLPARAPPRAPARPLPLFQAACPINQDQLNHSAGGPDRASAQLRLEIGELGS